MSKPCAAEIIEANHMAILSEAAGSFDKEFLLSWIAENESGFFVRHENSPMDCYLLTPKQFHTLYTFDRGDVGAMFRRITSTAPPNPQGGTA